MEETQVVQIKDVAFDEYFKRKATAKKVYVRGAYDRASKRYSCYETNDVNKEIFLKGETEVHTGFTY